MLYALCPGGNVALARTKAVAKRKTTLLAEWEASQKANSFQDRRIGEKVGHLSVEDKMLARFKRQQSRMVKRKRASKFSLADADGGAGDMDELTHGGKRLKDVDFAADRLDGPSDEDDDGFSGAVRDAVVGTARCCTRFSVRGRREP